LNPPPKFALGPNFMHDSHREGRGGKPGHGSPASANTSRYPSERAAIVARYSPLSVE